jgi:hypothetical protein
MDTGGKRVKPTDIVLIITAIGAVLFGVLERIEKIEQAKVHDHVVAEIASAAQATGEGMR